MQDTPLLSTDELLDHAYEIFLELAADNLSQEQIALFNAEFETRGALGDSEPDADWQEYLDFELDPARHVEICIGLRITSYNVCYTKLLRIPSLPARPRSGSPRGSVPPSSPGW